jgi:hypothetical protein
VPTGILTDRQAAKLCALVARYKHRGTLGRSWKGRSPDELWLKVLAQIVVVGNAGPGYIVQDSSEAKKQPSLTRLRSYRGDLALRRHIHEILRLIGTRYVGKHLRTDKKSVAAVHNFRVLMKAGGPRRFFRKLAAVRSEAARIDFLRKHFRFYQEKSARDTLIELGLAKNCLALDARIAGLLGKFGARAPQPLGRHYEQIERELIARVARPLGLSGAQLDRILFQNYDLIRADIAIAKAMRG